MGRLPGICMSPKTPITADTPGTPQVGEPTQSLLPQRPLSMQWKQSWLRPVLCSRNHTHTSTRALRCEERLVFIQLSVTKRSVGRFLMRSWEVGGTGGGGHD